MIFSRSKRGFTFIELLIYIVIFAFVLGALSLFAVRATRIVSEVKKESEVRDSARIALERITRAIDASSEIDTATSVFNDPSGVLVLTRETDSGPETVRFEKAGSAIAVSIGGGATENITSDEVDVLSFTLSRSAGARSSLISIDLEIASAGETSGTIFSTASLLRNYGG